MDFTLKVGNRLPVIDYTLSDADGAIDLTDAEVHFIYRKSGETTGTVRDAVITDAVAGKVRYSWTDEDNLTEGEYTAEFEVTFVDGKVETFPNDGYITYAILENLRGDS